MQAEIKAKALKPLEPDLAYQRREVEYRGYIHKPRTATFYLAGGF